MNEEGNDYVSTPSGMVFLVVPGDTWMVRVGVTQLDTRMSLWFAPCAINDLFPDPGDWIPLYGRTISPTITSGTSALTSATAGGPCTVRGRLDSAGYLRVLPEFCIAEAIPVHIQVGTRAFHGNLSTKDVITYFIDEESTLEDLLN